MRKPIPPLPFSESGRGRAEREPLEQMVASWERVWGALKEGLKEL